MMLLKKAVFVLTISLLIAGSVFAADEWKIYTDYRDIREIISLDDRLWCATSGGIAEFNPDNESFRLYSTIDGLNGMNVTAMAEDGDGGLWIGFNNCLDCLAQRFEPGVGVTHSIDQNPQADPITRINRIDVGTMGVFLATNRGVARITFSDNFNRWVWKEEYTSLGSFATDQPATSILQDGQYLWVGTDVGVARGDLNTPLPYTWVNFTTQNGLPGNVIRDITRFNGEIIVATDQGLANWDGYAWRQFSSTTDVRRMQLIDDSLRVIRHAGIYTKVANGWQVNTQPRNWISSFDWDSQGRIWGGMMFDNGGIYRGGIVLATDSSYIEYIPNGPVSNTALDFDFMADGTLLMVGGYGTGHHGLCSWNGTSWTTWSRPDFIGLMFEKQNRTVLADMDGGAWVGSWGGGMAHYRPDGQIDNYNHSIETGQRLIGYGAQSDPQSAEKVLVSDLALDQEGNIWLVNASAEDGNVLVCIPREFVQDPTLDIEWYYFHRSLFRNYPHFQLLAVDGAGRKWIASGSPEVVDSKGIYAFDDNGTLDNTDDDRVWGPFPGLNDPQVFTLKYDPEGYLWAGTVDGAYYLNTNVGTLSGQSFTQLYPTRDTQINSIEIDIAGNKWFGHPSGVDIIGTDLFSVQRRITLEAPDMLPGKNVNSVAINPSTGWVYFGTDQGTAAMFTPYRDFGAAIEEVTFEPNPFNPNDGRMVFTGNSLADMAEARIFTPDGRLVRSLSHNEAASGWDGYNDTGHKVASGVYLVVTHTDDGNAATGKVAVFWK